MAASGRRYRLVGVSVAMAAGMATLAGRAMAADEPKPASPDRIASIEHIMAGIHAPHCGAIGELLKGEGPKEDKTWAELAMHAALLNESGHLLMQNGRCPDAVWAEAAAALRGGSAGVFAAAGKKDLKAAQESFKQVTASCQSCHAKHKNKPPAPAAAVTAKPEPAAVAAAKAEPAAQAATPPAASAAQATQPAAAEPRVASVRHIMAGINAPNCSALGAALKNNGPGDDKVWQDVVRFASLLNEAGFILMENRRCPDDVWKNAAIGLRENAAKVAHAGSIKNLEDARTGFKGVTASCASCHQVHKKPAS